MAGWKIFHESKPNKSHQAIALLEQHGYIKFLITQNVDRLHQKAGSISVCDLHGRNDKVCCQSCGGLSNRRILHKQIEIMNKDACVALEKFTDKNYLRADGDAEIENVIDMNSFKIPTCFVCGGTLKPDVTFFGDNVPVDKVNFCFDKVNKSDGLLVIGTSLEVYSAFRFVTRAIQRNIPIAVINKGQTRLDRTDPSKIALRIDENSSIVLQKAFSHLEQGSYQL